MSTNQYLTPIQGIYPNAQLGISETADGDLDVSFLANVTGPDGKTHESLQTVEIAPPGAENAGPAVVPDPRG